jgi:hypothetical protein
MKTKIQVYNNDWQTKKLVIKNKTVKTLSNGVVVPTWSAVTRKAVKG